MREIGKLRILQLGKYYPPDYGGMETVLANLSEGLAATGVQVTCLVCGSDGATITENIAGVELIRARRWAEVASTPLSSAYLALAERLKPQLVHVHLPNPLASLAALRLRCPVIVTYHCDVLSYPGPREMYNSLMRVQLQSAKKVLISSEELLASSPLLAECRDKCVVVPFGVPPAPPVLTKSGKKLFECLRHRFPEGYVLFVGRLVKYKGLQNLIHSIKGLKRHLVVVGEGPERPGLERLIRRESLEPYVHLEGAVDSDLLAAYYKACRLVALVSTDRREAFGITLIEGLAFGKPLISTQLETGIDSVNVHGLTGLQVKPAAIVETRAAIISLFSDQPTYQTLEKNCLSRYQSKYTIRKMIDHHLELYEITLSDSKQP